MPQMMIETFVSQYFWLLVFFLSLNFYIQTKMIPSLARALKIRRKASFKESNIQNDEININISLGELNQINKDLTSFDAARKNWLTNK